MAAITEHSMSRLLTLFHRARVSIMSAEISMDTVKIMMDSNREDFFKTFSSAIGRRVTVLNATTVSPTELQLYNKKAMQALKREQGSYMQASGAFSYDGKNTTLESTLLFVDISNAETSRRARAFFQKAYIYVQRGLFFYFDSDDCTNYTPVATVKAEDAISQTSIKGISKPEKEPGVRYRGNTKPNTDSLFGIKGSEPAKTGTLHGNKSFMINFDFSGTPSKQKTGMIDLESKIMKAASTLSEDPDNILIPGIGIMRFDQAKNEINLWAAEIAVRSESGDYEGVFNGLKSMEPYAHAVALRSKQTQGKTS